jgi:23S rRNA pseudouridine1911/1915/1917 synthase
MVELDHRVFEIRVPDGKDKERLDIFLLRHLTSVTRARLKRLIDQDNVTVDGRPSKAGHPIHPGEIIRVIFPERVITEVEPEDIPLDIVFEDDHVLVVNKPAGMVVHPAYANLTGTLVNALLAHCRSLSSVGGEKRPGLVHRLDKDTSGLLVIAKDDLAHVFLAKQLSERKMEREYRAIVWRHPRDKTGRIEAPLTRHSRDRTRMTIRADGKHSVTYYEVMEALPLTSYVRLNLETGRTHQIRVHMASIGHPVFGDATYGGRNKQLAGLNHENTLFATKLLKRFTRQMLHAHTIAFVHPCSGKLMRFDAPLPYDMQELLCILRDWSV